MKTELILTLTFILSIILKLFHLPGGSLILIFSLITLGVIYFPFGFYFFQEGMMKKKHTILSILIGFFLTFLVLSILFKLQYWVGAKLFFNIGIFPNVLALLLVIYLTTKSKTHLKKFYTNMIIRLSFFLILSITLNSLSFENIRKIQYGNEYENIDP